MAAPVWHRGTTGRWARTSKYWPAPMPHWGTSLKYGGLVANRIRRIE
jgi:hypothetical protein